MNEPASEGSTPGHDLVVTRLIDAPRAALFRAWTDPALLRRWFAPAPFTVSQAEFDVRPGGASLIVMRGPGGEEMPMRGVYLEVVPDERLVMTDAYIRAWEPSPKPFMTIVLTLADEMGGTRYTARVRHWSAADRDAHIAMGFEQGWNACLDQLVALLQAG